MHEGVGMPSDKVAVDAYLPEDLYRRVIQFQQERELHSISRTVEVLLRLGLEKASATASQTPSRALELQAFSEELVSALTERLEALEQQIADAQIPYPKNIHPLRHDQIYSEFPDSDVPFNHPDQPNLPQTYAQRRKSWLTTGEAYQEALKRGWEGSRNTFRRRLEGGSIPGDLSELGLVGDYVERAKNPRDRTLRWLKFN